MGGSGMVREVDRAIGAISTLVVGLGLIALREYWKSDKDGRNQWERYELSDDGKDVYYQKKYGAPKMALFQHRGSCDCGAIRFFILAPKRVEAFDDSNTLSCKKGRFPYLLLPTSCFEMVQAPSVSVYEPASTSTQHAFCGKCGVHIFHFDHALPEFVAVNLYSVDDDNFDDVKIIFVPKGSRPLLGASRRLPLAVEQAAYRPLTSAALEPEVEVSGSSSVSFQKQLMLWAHLDKKRNGIASPESEDTQSSSSTSGHSQRLSFASEDPVSVIDMKGQLEFYLKRHLDGESAVITDNQALV